MQRGKESTRVIRIMLHFWPWITAFLLLLTPHLAAVPNHAHLLTNYWPAQWITCPKAPAREIAVCNLRKSFTLAAQPEHFVVHVSADNRYELFVNGMLISRGPSLGDLGHWRYETVDLATDLRAGLNTVAAVVWNYAELAPMAQMSKQTGFLLQGGNREASVLNTDVSWKTQVNQARTLLPLSDEQVKGYYVAGLGERVDGVTFPWGWQADSYDDRNWQPARLLGNAGPRGMRDTHSPWMLVPDPLPPQEETPQRLERVVRAQGVTATPAFLAGTKPFVVPPHSSATILLDQTFETTAYPQITVSGGAGSRIGVTYAEALVTPEGKKGNRNEVEGKAIQGITDEFLPDGGEHRAFAPLWWRAYRYVQISIHTQGTPLTVEDFQAQFTAYPLQEKAVFASDDASLQRIWEVAWRTARLCAHETYMDSPYYEQLQYVGDTRIQALITLYLSGDDRLVKNAIELIGDSQTSEGLMQSRYPSALPQYIPGFSLYWIGMMHDLWWYRGEGEMLRPLLPNVRAVLAWYQRHLTPSGLLGRVPWWPFVDWAQGFQDGVPPQEADGQSAVLTLEFAVALREAAGLESALGDREQARLDRKLATETAAAVFKKCWDPAKYLLADTPQKRSFSQQANILGVLADSVPESQRKTVMRRVLRDSTLTHSSYYYKFYLFRALGKSGMADLYLEQLGPWRDMLAEGLSTFAETSDEPRSDCHAWSAHPAWDLLATVAGIEPAAPAFAAVRIAPHLGQLHRLQASMPHPRGMIRVNYQRQADRLIAEIELPAGLAGSLVWKGQQVALRPGKQHITLRGEARR